MMIEGLFVFCVSFYLSYAAPQISSDFEMDPITTTIPIPLDLLSNCLVLGHFKCGGLDDECIPGHFVCDGRSDCSDSSDELECFDNLPSEEEFLLLEYLYCKEDQFKCSDGNCISKSNLCDGIKHCKNGDDENGFCGACEYKHCSHRCQDTPHGAECSCPINQTLSVDMQTCEHIDLCNSVTPVCQQFCTQEGGQYMCSCSEGFTLGEDKSTCDLNADYFNGSIFYIYGDNSIHRQELFNQTNFEEFVPIINDVKKISSLAFNKQDNILYFVTSEGHRESHIYAHNGIYMKSIYHGFGIKYIAYDWVSGNIYYASNGVGIGVCSKSGLYCSHLITGHPPVKDQLIQTYADLIVHPKRGILIWLDYNADHPSGVIMVAGMDGRNPRVIGGMNSGYLLSISLDYIRDELYILEGEQLSVLSLHTLKRKVFEHHIHPSAMLTFNDYFYFVARENNNLLRFKKYTDFHNQEILQALDGSQFALTINHWLYYPEMENPCLKANCSYLCTIREGVNSSAKCLCPDKYLQEVDSEVCKFSSTIEGPVKISPTFMEERCAQELACHNGGRCKESYGNESTSTTPACECLQGFDGLYCEQTVDTHVSTGNKWLYLFPALVFFFVFLVWFVRVHFFNLVRDSALNLLANPAFNDSFSTIPKPAGNETRQVLSENKTIPKYANNYLPLHNNSLTTSIENPMWSIIPNHSPPPPQN